MATRKPARKTPQLREAQAAYGTATRGEQLWEELMSLPEPDRNAFFQKLLSDPDMREDLPDSIHIIETRDEPSRPYREIREELIRDGLL